MQRFTDMGLRSYMEKISEHKDYSSAVSRKKLVDSTFADTAKEIRIAGCTFLPNNVAKRKKAVLAAMPRVVSSFRSIKLNSVEESFAEYESYGFISYGGLILENYLNIAAAIWVLDQLRKTEQLHLSFQYLPNDRELIEEIELPLDLYHPCYTNELIQAMAYVLFSNKKSGFKEIMHLLGEKRIGHAVQSFQTLQWDAISRMLKADKFFADEVDCIHKQNTEGTALIRGIKSETNQMERAMRAVELRGDRREFILTFTDYLGKDSRFVLGYRELGRIMSGFVVQNPFEICFALLYMLATNEQSVWLTKAGVAVITAASLLLPWYDPDGEYEIDYEDDDWDDKILVFNRNGWLDRAPVEERADYYHKKIGKWTLDQHIYRLCRGIVPVGFHPFSAEREVMRKDGVEEADMIADLSEMMFLSSFQAGQLICGGYSLKQHDTEDDEKKVETADSEDGSDPDIHALQAELQEARKQVKELHKELYELRHETEVAQSKAEQELKSLRMEHRELADLRELVFNQEHEHPEELEKPTKQIDYPYEPLKRTVVFGGHDTFLKAFKPLFPSVRFVDARQLAFDTGVIRNADVVWIQNNCMSHPQYWKVVKACKVYDVQLRYFAYASAEKCAEQLVIEDQK